MKRTNRWRMVVVGCVIGALAGGAWAQDWPQWRGPNRDGKVEGFEAPQKWPLELTKKWSAEVGKGDATPALVDDKLYVFVRQGGEEVTLCLDADNGEPLWRDAYAAQEVTGAAGRHPGPRSSPTVADGKVITLGVGGVVSCLNATNGKVLWRKDPFPKLVPRFFTSTSPLVVDDRVVAHLGGEGNGALIAFDLNSGEEKWRWDEEGPEYASPVLLTVGGTRQIVTLTEKSIVGVDVADGSLLWKLPFVPERRAYNAATPIVDGQTVIYAGAQRGTQAVRVTKEGEGFAAEELWSNPELAPQYNTPVLVNGLLFGLSNRGNLFCLDAETGKAAWVDETSRDRSGFTAIVAAGDYLMALPSNSELIVFKPNAEKLEKVAEIQVAETPTYAHPVIAGHRIVIKDEDAVTMWTL